MVATRPPDASAYGDSGAGQLVRQYLESKNMPYTPDNVRRAIQANARDSTVMGPDPIAGLRNADAGSDAGVGQGSKSVASKIEGNPPPANLGEVANAKEFPGTSPTGTPGTGESPQTSAQPGGSLDVSNIGQMIAQGLALGGAAAGGGYLAGGNRPNYQLGMGEPGVPATTADPSAQPVGDQYRVLTSEQPTAPVSDMDMAMARAMEPAGGPPRLGGPPDISGIHPMVNPSQVIGPQALPPGISNLDAVNAGGALPSATQPPAIPPGEGNIPITPKVGPQPPVRSLPEVRGGRLLGGFLRR